MNTLIMWSDNAGPATMYQVPTKMLMKFGDFNICHNHFINSGADEDEKPDIYNRIEYLAWLLGEERYYGEIPSLTEWLALNRTKEAVASAEGQDRGATLKKSVQDRESSDPPLTEYKREGNELHKCDRIINTGWFM